MTSNRTFSPQEMNVLIALQEKPSATLEELARVTSFGTSLVYKILKRLTETKIHEKPAFSITAHPNQFALGLEVIDVIVKCKNLSQIQIMHQLSIIHPYTIYRAKCFGEVNGIFFQFRIPIGTKQFIEALFSRLKEKKYIESYQILEFGAKNVIYTTVKLESWNLEQLSWNFNWNNWFQTEIELSQKDKSIQKKSEKNLQNTVRHPGYIKKWFKKRDVAILNECVIDARRKNKEIMDVLETKNQINFSPQSFSRRFMKIKEECIDFYRVFIDPNAFQLITPVLILGKGEKMEIKKLVIRLQKDPIPFNSVLKSKNSHFFWYLHLPSLYLTQILHKLQAILTEIQFFYIDVGTVKSWGMWHETYDNDNHDWIHTHEFMVDDVLIGISKFAKDNIVKE
ncbi:hypothetical protein DSAG12_03226 [Promethearchaeum syntrophicum]|uniref:Uncharacterized protein n=1 Tax=Promethearchaeum syntrophicum TaxID=2594042 RepID=A0A5B9DE70_9ARCH|nr:hypothetical protein [Candidatus Prometheoarchaeum syntrophicum]QEE17392.1 hypothetical protein DSAG12_03226 [Candidatus Prometheoarchaeum syntrophicum]